MTTVNVIYDDASTLKYLSAYDVLQIRHAMQQRETFHNVPIMLVVAIPKEEGDESPLERVYIAEEVARQYNVTAGLRIHAIPSDWFMLFLL